MNTEIKLELIFDTFWLHFDRLLGPFWKPFGNQKAMQNPVDFWMRFWRRQRGGGFPNSEQWGVPAPTPLFLRKEALGEARVANRTP